MEINLGVRITENKTEIQWDSNQNKITIFHTPDQKVNIETSELYFLLQDNQLTAIGHSTIPTEKVTFNKIIKITSPWDIELGYLEQLFIRDAKENGVELANIPEVETKIPVSSEKTISEYKDEILLILERFGYHLKPQEEPKKAKTKPAKARHRWTKEVSQVEFFIDTRESKATALWHKRNEMLIRAGATMMAEPPLNKDGSLGFSAKMGQRIREDHKDKVKNFITTEDIILKSVNEVGLFLYFGGTNSWLELIDENGKTINEWTVVD